jgi:hypothetical protein
MRGIAFRRAQRARLMRNRRNYWGGKLTGQRLSVVVDTPKPCSCPMCGNPRRIFDKPTIQELKADEACFHD